jgi:hypothetical protein
VSFDRSGSVEECSATLRSTRSSAESELMAPACVFCARLDDWRCEQLTDTIKFNDQRCVDFEPVDADAARYEHELWSEA